MNYQLIVGLEVHCQLLTESKLFTGCINRFNPDAPNTQTDPVILALPGTLPVMNRKAFRLAVKTAMALNCEIARFTKWDRKQYFYPDLPKGYQISQYDLPFSSAGWLDVPEEEGSDQKKRIRINRVHLEDDAGKNIHDETGGESCVDLNRAGTPLLEIVSEPDMESAFQARKYLEELRLLLLYLGVSDCNMQEGSLRCDANVNIKVTKDDGETIATPIVEIKNMNSFRNIELTIDYEAKRQFKDWQKTGLTIKDVGKQTRGWNAERQVTFVQREKEDASDYRYFPDPDLVPVTVEDSFLDEVNSEFTEFPAARRERYQNEFKLSEYDASVIVDQRAEFADYFETVAKLCGDGKQAANWVTQDVLREINERKIEVGEFGISADVLGTLLKRIVDQKITVSSGREVFGVLLELDEKPNVDDVDKIVAERGLEVVSDTGQIQGIVDAVIARNEKIANDVRGGKQQAVGPLIGQVMKELKGADPKTIRQLLIDTINS